jgi:hypothetical protein
VLHLREEGRAAVGVPVLVGSYATEINLPPYRLPALIWAILWSTGSSQGNLRGLASLQTAVSGAD